MKEIKAIISAYDKIDRKTIKAALATVVRVEGSSYRRTGARMLVMDNGIWVGGISGGCLEGDALMRARSSILKSESTLITYDTTEDDPYQIGVGLGCNGIIDVLFTPLDFNNKNNPVEVLKSCLQSDRQTNILIIVTDTEGKWEMVKPGDSIQYKGPESLAFFGSKELQVQLHEKIDQQIANERSALEHFELSDGKKLSAFIEMIMPEIHIVLMGHQYDIYPLARIAKEIGWRVSVVSNPLKINPALSGIVDKVLSNDQVNELCVDDHTAILLMSHDYKTDKSNLEKVLRTSCHYIGMLGPKVRAERIFRELEAKGVMVSDNDLTRIFAPAGLDIGAMGPEEIALSLIAEIRAVFSARQGGFLKLRKSTIHERNQVQKN